MARIDKCWAWQNEKEATDKIDAINAWHAEQPKPREYRGKKAPQPLTEEHLLEVTSFGDGTFGTLVDPKFEDWILSGPVALPEKTPIDLSDENAILVDLAATTEV